MLRGALLRLNLALSNFISYFSLKLSLALTGFPVADYAVAIGVATLTADLAPHYTIAWAITAFLFRSADHYERTLVRVAATLVRVAAILKVVWRVRVYRNLIGGVGLGVTFVFVLGGLNSILRIGHTHFLNN